MREGVGKSPAFSCYPKDLLGDSKVAMMSNEEFGAYWRLCCFSWEDGSIPADLGELALMLPRTTKKQMERMWRIIGRCFVPSPNDNSRLVQPRIEIERKRQAEHRRKQAENGRKGGRPTKPRENPNESGGFSWVTPGLAETEPRKSLSSSSSSSSSSSKLASLATAGAPARESETVSDLQPRSQIETSPAYAFCAWLLVEGINAGAIPAHHGLDPFRWCYPQMPVAQTLLDTYGEDEGRIRAGRFIAARTAKPPKIHRALTVQSLLDVWDWDPIRSDGARAPLSADDADYYARLRSETEEG